MNGINMLNDRIDAIDERLRGVENKISKAMGWGAAMFVILIVIQIGLRLVNVSISFK